MSNIISSETKSVEITKEERTRKLTIHTPKGSDYWGELVHETVEMHDGTLKSSTDNSETSPIVFLMSKLMARVDTFTYTDLQGKEQTVKSSDVPLIVQAFCDVLRSEV